MSEGGGVGRGVGAGLNKNVQWKALNKLRWKKAVEKTSVERTIGGGVWL